jgi:hypothetical protein
VICFFDVTELVCLSGFSPLAQKSLYTCIYTLYQYLLYYVERQVQVSIHQFVFLFVRRMDESDHAHTFG